MTNSQDIIAAAQALRPQLPDLIGEQADTVGPQLDELLAQAEQGQPVANQIRSLIRPHPAAHSRMVEFLEQQQDFNLLTPSPQSMVSRGFDPLAGDVHDIPAGKYICPKCEDGNAYFLHYTGGDVPPCNKHDVPVVRVPANG